MARVLVTRPEPGASRTAAALVAAGHEVVLRPLMAVEAVDWTLPGGDFDAVMLTSVAAAGVRGADALKGLPAFCVGEATAAAARAAGFWRAEAVGGDVSAVLARVKGRVLHLAGEDRTAVSVPDAVELVVRVVYRAVLLPLGDVGVVDAVMLFSARSAGHFVQEWGGRERGILVVAMSGKVAAAVGFGWKRVVVAAQPDEGSMLAALADAGL